VIACRARIDFALVDPKRREFAVVDFIDSGDRGDADKRGAKLPMEFNRDFFTVAMQAGKLGSKDRIAAQDYLLQSQQLGVARLDERAAARRQFNDADPFIIERLLRFRLRRGGFECRYLRRARPRGRCALLGDRDAGGSCARSAAPEL